MTDTLIIRQIAEEILQESHLFLLDVTIRKGNRILVTIDGDHGVTIDDCARLSRSIESRLNRDEDDFELQVSTAGADSPLKLKRQYPKHCGRTLELTLDDGRKLRAVLVSVSEEGLYMLPEKGKTAGKKPAETAEEGIRIAWENIGQSVVIVSF